MIQKLCIWIVLMMPAFRLGVDIAKTMYGNDNKKSAIYAGAIFYVIIVYCVYYFCGLFSLI